jgi:hypothetical protein
MEDAVLQLRYWASEDSANAITDVDCKRAATTTERAPHGDGAAARGCIRLERALRDQPIVQVSGMPAAHSSRHLRSVSRAAGRRAPNRVKNWPISAASAAMPARDTFMIAR